MSPLQIWWLTVRPKTLSVSVVPVVVGSLLARAESDTLLWPPFIAALLAAVLIQVGTNLHNDAADFERGADTDERLGPRRASAQGWLTTDQVRRGALLSFAGAFILGIYLVWHGGWPIMLLGLASIASGYAYTGGPRPIAYSPFGELFVLLFFGLAAVGGSYYLQTFTLSANALWCGVALGLPAAAVLMINNYRDLDTDRKVGKLTLVHYIGRANTRRLYTLSLLLTPVLMVPLYLAGVAGPWLLLTGLTLPIALRLASRLTKSPIGPDLNALLAQTAQYQLIFALLLLPALTLS